MLVFFYFIEFPRADIGAGIGTVEFLDDFFDGDAAGGSQKEFEFIEIFLGAPDCLAIRADTDEDGPLGDFLVDKGISLLRRWTLSLLSDAIAELTLLIWIPRAH